MIAARCRRVSVPLATQETPASCCTAVQQHPASWSTRWSLLPSLPCPPGARVVGLAIGNARALLKLSWYLETNPCISAAPFDLIAVLYGELNFVTPLRSRTRAEGWFRLRLRCSQRWSTAAAWRRTAMLHSSLERITSQPKPREAFRGAVPASLRSPVVVLGATAALTRGCCGCASGQAAVTTARCGICQRETSPECNRPEEDLCSFVNTESVSKELLCASKTKLLICNGFAETWLGACIGKYTDVLVVFCMKCKHLRKIARKRLVNKVIHLDCSLGSFVLHVGSWAQVYKHDNLAEKPLPRSLL